MAEVLGREKELKTLIREYSTLSTEVKKRVSVEER